MTPGFDRVLSFEKVANFRDFGYWRAADGARVAVGRLFRSGHLHYATDTDLARMEALGIVSVTDLRHPGEQRAQPSRWIGKLPLKLIEEPAAERSTSVGGRAEPPHIKALRANAQDLASMQEFMAANYVEMPFDVRLVTLFRRYFETLASGNGVMLIHCAAGKDRTGILAWLTHRALGVHRDDALEDFLLSNATGGATERLRQGRRYMEKVHGITASDEVLGSLLSVEPEYLERCEASLVAHSGSVDGYLADVLAVNQARRDRIRASLLV